MLLTCCGKGRFQYAGTSFTISCHLQRTSLNELVSPPSTVIGQEVVTRLT